MREKWYEEIIRLYLQQSPGYSYLVTRYLIHLPTRPTTKKNEMLEMLDNHRRLSSRVFADDNRRLSADSTGNHP